MNARRRFLLAAAAPALENIGTLAVLGAVAALYGTGAHTVSTGELVLLGLGTTGAVALHAAVQWWGARRVGVTLLPRAGWREPEVRAIVRRSLPSLAQAGLVAAQTLTLLMVANRVAGGVVAFQLGLNFYALAIALAAQPVALSLLPRLSRMHSGGELALFRDTLARGVALGLFLAVPAAVGYLVLAGPLAHAVTFGRMGDADGVTMVALSLAGLAGAVVGDTVFMISTYAWYAGKDTRTPLYSMLVQAAICLVLAAAASRLSGLTVLLGLGLALSAAQLVAAGHLSVRLWRALPAGAERLGPSVAKVVTGAAVLAGPAWLTARLLGPRVGTALTLAAAIAVGAGAYLAVQAVCRAPELRWLAGGLRYLRGARADG
jgi:putative peptidoglycan lipid II flippase